MGEAAAEDYRRRSRRSWTAEQKLSILDDLAASGDPLAEVARRHGLNANQLLTWRGRARAGTLDRQRGRPPGRGAEPSFVRVDLARVVAGVGAAASLADERIEVELTGGATVRFAASVDADRLYAVLRVVRSAL